MSSDAVLTLAPLGFLWPTLDPFLFCAHHADAYPAGDARMAPVASLAGREMGRDFSGKDGFSMYHGDVVPGFPQHPHRGFETVTIVRKGLVDHSDSLGAAARFGAGDVQWLTAGQGIVHSEMFPLVHAEQPNPTELFQIWLNLPRANKLVPPHFSMFWHDRVPVHESRDAAGRVTQVTVIAGRLAEVIPNAPPPKSWAAQPDSDVAIWTLKLAANAKWTLPPTAAVNSRVLYFFAGTELRVAGQSISGKSAVQVRADLGIELENGSDESELLLLQGKPIAEPVTQHGPFVMNSTEEIRQAFADYQRTRFGGWPWPSDGPAHARGEGRFARHPDGRIERPT